MERSLRRVARDARDYAWIMARTPTTAAPTTMR
jgi:lipocalin